MFVLVNFCTYLFKLLLSGAVKIQL